MVEKYLDVIELKLKPHFSAEAHQNDKIMKIQVEVNSDVMQAVMNGKRVVGALQLKLASNGTHSEVTFGAFNLTRKRRRKDQLIKALEHGWVKQSECRVKVYNSLPKTIGAKRMVAVLERETKLAAEAIIDNEIINRV